MTTSKNTSAFLRYFYSRFKPFTKPVFLVSLGGLLISGLAVYQYWQHPEWLQTNSDDVTDTNTPERAESENPFTENVAETDNPNNFDSLLEDIGENNIRALSQGNSESDRKSLGLKKEESEFSRFQKEQKNKLDRAGQSDFLNSSNPYFVGIGGGNQKIMELLQPPSFSSYQSTVNSTTRGASTTTNPQTDIIPNPVGNNYLTSRNQLEGQNPASSVTSPFGVKNIGLPSNGVPSNNNAPSNSNPNNPTESLDPSLNGQNPQTNNIQPFNSSLGSTFTPASSLIQSRQTLPAPITSSAPQSSTTTFIPTNPYLGAGYTYRNPYGTSNQVGNSFNGVSANPINGLNSNGASNGVGSNVTGINSQGTQNPNYPGSTVGGNSLNGENGTNTESTNSPGVLQNNYRSPQTITTPNYNRSVPAGFRLQPQNYSGLGSQRQNNSVGVSGVGNTNSVGVTNNGINSNSAQPTTNAPITRPFGTPSLQPSGVLSTSEIGR